MTSRFIFSNHYPVLKPGKDIMRGEVSVNHPMTMKYSSERIIEDSGPLFSPFTTEWEMIGDKGYQGAAEFVRLI